MVTGAERARQRAVDTIAEMRSKIAKAAREFEVGYTEAGLARVDPDLAQALTEQIELYEEACLQSDPAQIRRQGEGLVRGWAAALERMDEDAAVDHQPEILFGQDQTGTKIAVTHQPGKPVNGSVRFTPDEIAGLISQTEVGRAMLKAKQAYPGAVAVVRPRVTEENTPPW